MPRRVVAKIEHHKDELFPRVGFIVTNLRRLPRQVVTRARYVIFQMAEVAVPKRLFRAILARIRQLRMPEAAPG